MVPIRVAGGLCHYTHPNEKVKNFTFPPNRLNPNYWSFILNWIFVGFFFFFFSEISMIVHQLNNGYGIRMLINVLNVKSHKFHGRSAYYIQKSTCKLHKNRNTRR